MQTRPKVAANGRHELVRIPARPWDDADRPGRPAWGRYDTMPRLWEFAPWQFGLCALKIQSKRLVEFATNPRAGPFSEQRSEPAVIRPLKLPARQAEISGVTLDSTSTPLGSCVVHLYLTATDEQLGTTTSNASTGAFNFTVARYSPRTHYIVAYKPGSPDVAGTTVNTLTGTG
jgi:hypothetical protein